MSEEIRLEYHRRPSAARFMAGVLRPSPGLDGGGSLPDIQLRWRGHHAEGGDLSDYLALSGLPAGDELCVLYPQTMAFPLHMALLTHPHFPVPIWRLLQVRNRLRRHRPLPRGARYDLSVRLAALRPLEKGVEFDLAGVAEADGAVVWESVNTFYMRGRPLAGRTPEQAPEPPRIEASRSESWRMPVDGGWRYGRISGDYNPLHWFGAYARRHGFGRAFLHPQRVLGQCLARLGARGATELEAWIKGPVFYGAEVEMRSDADAEGIRFALHVEGDARPAFVGRVGHGAGR